MEEELIFNEQDYDLDGILGKSEMAMADFIFMICEEGTEHYYMDRIEGQKYDSSFHKFVQRVESYLERDENHGVFVLFAAIKDKCITLYDGSGVTLENMQLGDIDSEEDSFYGMLIQYEEGNYVFHQAIYINEHYEGDARATIIHNAGELTDRIQKYILAFH